MKVALMWVSYGPYHLARMRVLRKALDVTAIEFAASQELYGWMKSEREDLVTLSGGSHERAGRLRQVRHLWKTLNAERPAVLLIPGYQEPAALAAALWGKLHGSVNVLMSDSTAPDLPRKRWREWIKGRAIRVLYDKAFVSGHRAEAYLRSLGFNGRQVERGYDVVDNEYFADKSSHAASRPSEPSLNGANRFFLYTGRLASVKNVGGLLRSYAGYRREGGRRQLILAGAGPEENTLKTLTSELGCADAVEFVGLQSYETLPASYGRAHCLVLPSVSEPWGLVVNEAMACGLPLIVSDRCGCVDELVEPERNGFVFRATDEKALTECLRRMDGLSAEEWSVMGQRSREIVARFSLEDWVSAVVRLAEGQPV